MENEIANRVFKQVMELWVLPEIERRRKEKILGESFILTKAQILFSHDKSFPKIRLNQQVKAIAKSKANRDIKKGEEITGDYTEELPPGTYMKCNCGSKKCKKIIRS